MVDNSKKVASKGLLTNDSLSIASEGFIDSPTQGLHIYVGSSVELLSSITSLSVTFNYTGAATLNVISQSNVSRSRKYLGNGLLVTQATSNISISKTAIGSGNLLFSNQPLTDVSITIAEQAIGNLLLNSQSSTKFINIAKSFRSGRGAPRKRRPAITPHYWVWRVPTNKKGDINLLAYSNTEFIPNRVKPSIEKEPTYSYNKPIDTIESYLSTIEKETSKPTYDTSIDIVKSYLDSNINEKNKFNYNKPISSIESYLSTIEKENTVESKALSNKDHTYNTFDNNNDIKIKSLTSNSKFEFIDNKNKLLEKQIKYEDQLLLNNKLLNNNLEPSISDVIKEQINVEDQLLLNNKLFQIIPSTINSLIEEEDNLLLSKNNLISKFLNNKMEYDDKLLETQIKDEDELLLIL